MASEMPENILLQILAALDLPDLIRAGSVCSAWHGACTSLCNLGRWKQPQTPCLVYTAKSRGDSAAGLYSLSEKKAYTLALPDPPVRSMSFIGSAHGWIIAADDRSELHLINPITGDRIALPSITTTEFGRTTPNVYGLSELRDIFFDKAFLSSDPSTGNYIVAAIHNPCYRLSFARAGDDCWTLLPPHDDFGDCIFKDDLMYALTQLGEIHVFDFSGPAVKQKVVLEKMRSYNADNMYIVQIPCGDLLQIWGDYDFIPLAEDVSQPRPLEEDDDFSEPDLPYAYKSHKHYATKFKLFKVDLTANKLVEISSLGENVLFLGQNQSVCLCAEEHPQLKANRVYFTDNDEFCGRKNIVRDIGVLNLSDNSREYLSSPQIWSNWPSPVWITPNPKKMNSARSGSTYSKSQGTARPQASPTSCWPNVFWHEWSVA
ncbi:unnamed protein product [Urochloa decumbens]|uniref:F-box domain-containing protein n=1 Tax=Urochloa decumbens TaxID=240449 RepID=A0ABC8ZXG7_9POAL